MIRPVENTPAPTPRSSARSCAENCLEVELCRPGELSVGQIASWDHLLRDGLQQNSPFLHPQFTREVAAVRDDVEVAIMKQHGQTVGFFPFQRGGWNVGKPVGGRLSSYQGAVVGKDVDWTAEELVRGCKLSAWSFDQLDLVQTPFRAHARLTEGAAYLDLSHGYKAYRESRRAAGSERIVKIESLARKLEREIGSVRSEYHVPGGELVETLVAWKSAQFRETGLADVFAHGWTKNLLNGILSRPTETFAAVVSAFYAGSRPVAISYALRSHDVLHGMFIGYDREFSKYSPGLILLLNIARDAAERGIHRFHLGSGGEHYKRSLASGETFVGVGSVECRPLARWMRRGWELARSAAHSSALSPFTSGPMKLLRPVRERLSFR